MIQQRTYQARRTGPHIHETKGPNAPKWYVVDAKDQVVGRLATVLARVITGKHKPTYTKHVDTGDFIIVLNADKVVFTKDKLDKKLYRHHTNYLSGLKTMTARQLLDKHPDRVLKRAVWGMTNKSSLARRQLGKLKIFSGTEHDHKAQNPQPLPAGAVRKTVLSPGRAAVTK